jgi:hypothetical protein
MTHKTGCTGKSAFDTWHEANRRARRMRQRGNGAHVEPYHCKHCNQFHVGEARSYGKRAQRVAPEMEETP